MKCELAQYNIPVFAYGDLPDDESHALEQHLTSCAACREEFEAARDLQQAMALLPIQEPSANLLAQSRLRLDEALDAMPPRGWIMRVRQSISGGLSVLGHAPVAASALLLLGLGFGAFGGYRVAERGRQQAAPPAPAAEIPAQIATVSSIYRQPNTENVQVNYDRLVPETLQGSLDDPQIRQLLLAAAQSRGNPGVQQNSLSLLAAECRAGHQCSAGPVRRALLVALRYDSSPQVRLDALNGLQPYVAEDTRVRDAVLEALMNDDDPAVRSRAIGLLEPVEADSSVREVLHTVASEDDNPHIRTVSREVLDQLPQIQ